MPRSRRTPPGGADGGAGGGRVRSLHDHASDLAEYLAKHAEVGNVIDTLNTSQRLGIPKRHLYNTLHVLEGCGCLSRTDAGAYRWAGWSRCVTLISTWIRQQPSLNVDAIHHLMHAMAQQHAMRARRRTPIAPAVTILTEAVLRMLILLTVYHAEPANLHRNDIDDTQFVTVQDLDAPGAAPEGEAAPPASESPAPSAAVAGRSSAATTQPEAAAVGTSGAQSASTSDAPSAAPAPAHTPASGSDPGSEDYPYAASAVLLRHYVERGRPRSPPAARAGKRPAPRESTSSTGAGAGPSEAGPSEAGPSEAGSAEGGNGGGEEGRGEDDAAPAPAPGPNATLALQVPRRGEAYDEVLRRRHALPAPAASYWPRVHHVVGWFHSPHGSEIVPAVELGLLVQLTDELVAHYRDYEASQTAKRRRESELADGPKEATAPVRTRRKRTMRYSEDVIAAAAAADSATRARPGGAGPISMSKRLYEVFTILDAIGMAFKMELARAAPAAPGAEGAHTLPSVLREPVRSPADLFAQATAEGEGRVYLPESAAGAEGGDSSPDPASADQCEGAVREETRGYNPQRRKRMYAALNRLLLVPEPEKEEGEEGAATIMEDAHADMDSAGVHPGAGENLFGPAQSAGVALDAVMLGRLGRRDDGAPGNAGRAAAAAAVQRGRRSAPPLGKAAAAAAASTARRGAGARGRGRGRGGARGRGAQTARGRGKRSKRGHSPTGEEPDAKGARTGTTAAQAAAEAATKRRWEAEMGAPQSLLQQSPWRGVPRTYLAPLRTDVSRGPGPAHAPGTPAWGATMPGLPLDPMSPYAAMTPGGFSGYPMPVHPAYMMGGMMPPGMTPVGRGNSTGNGRSGSMGSRFGSENGSISSDPRWSATPHYMMQPPGAFGSPLSGHFLYASSPMANPSRGNSEGSQFTPRAGNGFPLLPPRGAPGATGVEASTPWPQPVNPFFYADAGAPQPTPSPAWPEVARPPAGAPRSMLAFSHPHFDPATEQRYAVPHRQGSGGPPGPQAQ